MFGRLIGPVRTLKGCRLYSQPASGGSKRRGFDRSMLKPALIVVVFGSMLSHVSNQQKHSAELDRRYELKMNILRKLISRAKEGDISFNVDEELQLVNKLFSRYSKSGNVSFEEEAEKIRKSSDSNKYSEKALLDSLNSSRNPLEEESLEEMFKSIMNEVNDTSRPLQKKSETIVVPSHDENEIVLNKKFLEEQAKREVELQNYTPSTDAHTIVDIPGDLSVAAKDTEIKSFL